MPTQDLKPVWHRIDEQAKDIQDLKTQSVLHDRMIEALAEEGRKASRDSSAQHGERLAATAAMAADIKALMEGLNVMRGERQVTRWLIPVLISIIGLVIYIK